MEPILIFGAIALAVTTAFWFFGHAQTVRRRLNAVPITPIDGVRGGLVRVVGRAHAVDGGAVAPGSGVGCLAYSVLITESAGRRGHQTIARFNHSVAFWLEDASGRLRVDAGANVEICSDAKQPTKGSVYGTDLLRMIRAQGIDDLTSWGSEKDLRFEEVVIAEGDTVSVLGLAHVDLDPTLPPPGPRQIATSIVLGPEGADRPVLIGDGDQRFLVPRG